MEDYKNILFCSVSYRRNIKDMPFVKTLTDGEQAIGVTRSLSEIFGDDYEFKSLKNLSLQDCKILEEDGTITANLIDNKDISAYGKSLDGESLLYINEQDHIRVIVNSKKFNLEECYKKANIIDDKILDKLEMSFNTDFGFLTSNPYLCGTGLEIEVLLFLPAIAYNNLFEKIENDLLKNQYDVIHIGNTTSPFFKIKNKYTFGSKENEIAENLYKIVLKIIELENNEESKIFDFSASHLADRIFRSYGILHNAYRLGVDETIELLGQLLWGINLRMLKSKKQFDILDVLCKIKENHLSEGVLSVKEAEKKRARYLSDLISLNIQKGEVDV